MKKRMSLFIIGTLICTLTACHEKTEEEKAQEAAEAAAKTVEAVGSLVNSAVEISNMATDQMEKLDNIEKVQEKD